MVTVSVVVPTRNRCKELLSTVRSVLASDHQDIRLYVFDNASLDGTRDAINALEDERIVYERSDAALSITDSFERAYGLAQGDWVTGLGADDGLTRGAISEMLSLALDANVRAVSTERASFHWPGVNDASHGRLHVRHVVDDEVFSSQATIRNVLRGREKYQALPTAYKSGLVHRSILESIRKRHTRLFDSWNPDVFLGFAVARTTPYFAKAGRPLAISGTSSSSTGLSTLGGGQDSAPGDEYFALSRQGSVPLDRRVGSVDGTLPKHMLIMTLEAYLRSNPHPRAAEAALASPLFQLGTLLGDGRGVSPEVLDWARSFARAAGTDLISRSRWAVAQGLGRGQRYDNRRRRKLASGKLPRTKQLTEKDAAQVITLARSCKGVTVMPAPETVAGAARILDIGLDADARIG